MAALGAAVAAVGGAGTAGAQGGPGAVLLRLRPRAGDTVRTRFEQSVKLLVRDGAEAEGAPLAPSGTMTVYAHSVVERADAAGAVVTAVTDSVALRASGAPAHATEAARRAMQGRRTRLRVSPDGATAVLGDQPRGEPGGGEAERAFTRRGRDPRGRDPRGTDPRGGDARSGDARSDAAMRFPAALPAGPVAPGAMWARAMTVPWGAGRSPAGSAVGSTIDVWFRFDSLARGGTLAFLSLRGTVRAPGKRGADVEGASPGDVDGALVVDLARGWVVDSRATFRIDGALTAPGGQPRPVRVVVKQQLRVL